jgi:hypothetical protein
MIGILVQLIQTHSRFLKLTSVILVIAARIVPSRTRSCFPQLLFIAHGVFIEFWMRKLAPLHSLPSRYRTEILPSCMYPFPFSWMSSFIELVVCAVSSAAAPALSHLSPQIFCNFIRFPQDAAGRAPVHQR